MSVTIKEVAGLEENLRHEEGFVMLGEVERLHGLSTHVLDFSSNSLHELLIKFEQTTTEFVVP